MKHLIHSDNTGSVGWTCIHAHMTPDEMRELLRQCPRGYLRMTALHMDDLGEVRTPERAAQYLEWVNNRCMARDWYELPFYFDFPLDQDGVKLLHTLGFDPENCRFWERRPLTV